MRIASDISQISHTPYATGVQRVVVETHKNLVEISLQKGDLFYGLNLSKIPPTTKNTYIWTDPLIRNQINKLTDVDIVLALDANINCLSEVYNSEKTKAKIFALVYDVLPITNPEWFTLQNRPNYHLEFRFYLMKLLKIADYLITTSSDTADAIENLNWNSKAKKVKVIPLGSFVDGQPRKFPNKSRDEKTINIISVNTVEPRKGHVDILDAIEILNHKRESYRLTFVGKKGWDSDHLVDQILNHPGYNKYLFWKSNLNDYDLLREYESSHISINASRGEGFGLTIEESLAHGLKVVARDINVFKERPNPNIYYFSGAGHEIANAIIKATESSYIANSRIRTMKDFAVDLYRFIENEA